MFGIGQVFSGIIMANVIDSLKSKKSCIINIIFMMAAAASSISTINQNEFNWLSYLNCALFGL